MSRLFGTDGVRGEANGFLTAEFSLALAQAAATVLGQSAFLSGKRATAVVARDPRASGEFLAAAVEAGLASSGVDVYDAGLLPTPAAAYLVASLSADFGVMISASHNPAADNGIKFFARGGRKLPDEMEDAIQEGLTQPPRRPVGRQVGRISRFADAEDRYTLHLLSTLPCRLEGLKVVVDCAHGAASGCSPHVLKNAGAEVVVIGAEPDGWNINDGVGSTHLDRLQEAVVRHGADLGIAHDGDADRCLAVDHEGSVVDGDHIMAILALGLNDAQKLRHKTLVTTVMSNGGLKVAMEKAGIHVHETVVGDRYVLEGMRSGNFSLGGEQSGHVIFSDYSTTGDGVLTGLQLAARVAQTGRSLQELASVMHKRPQVMINVQRVEKTLVASDSEVQATVAKVEQELGTSGRILLRASGTEPVVRVMVEAQDKRQAERLCARVAQVVQDRLTLPEATKVESLTGI